MVAVYKCFEMMRHPPSLFPYKMFILLVYKMCIISNPDFIGDDLFAMFHCFTGVSCCSCGQVYATMPPEVTAQEICDVTGSLKDKLEFHPFEH